MIDPKKAAEIERRLEAARGKSSRELLLELADAVIAEPPNLTPIPGVARWYAEQMAARAVDSGHLIDEKRVEAARVQWGRWYVRAREDLIRDGIRLLVEIRRDAPEELARFDAITARVAVLIRKARELALPWWPIYRTERPKDGGAALSVVEFAQRELGRLESWQIRAGGANAALPLLDPVQAALLE